MTSINQTHSLLNKDEKHDNRQLYGSLSGLTQQSSSLSDGDSTCSNSDAHSTSSQSTPVTSKQRSTLGILQFATIIFYSVSGGPLGMEESVRAAGPFWTIVGFLVAPLVFSLPECFMTMELSTSFPSAAAAGAWAEEAFGPHAGFLAGFLNYVSGATDNAIYPVLFLDYALQVFPSETLETGTTARFVVTTSITLGLAYLNWLGLDLVGNFSIFNCIIAMSPFVVFVICGASQVDPQRWFRFPNDASFEYDVNDYANLANTTMALAEAADDDDAMDMEGGFFPNIVLGGVLMRPLLNNLFWNFNSFDNAGSFAEDITNPAHVIPRGMILAWAMVFLGYILPLLVALGTSDAPPSEWVDGYLATIVSNIVGPWMGTWLVFAAALSNVGMFQAELSSDAYLLMGMSERGFLPSCLSVRSSHGTPTYALMLGTLVIVVMGVSNLDDLIEMLNFTYALALLLEYAAFLKLRISEPDVERPFRVPMSTVGCALALIPTIAALVAVVALASFTTIFVNVATLVIGTAVYSFMTRKEKAFKGYQSVSSPTSNSCSSQWDEEITLTV